LKLKVVIPYYNGEQYIERCIHSLDGYPKKNVFVIDNSEEKIDLAINATVIKTTKSKIGFAKAVNIGLEISYQDASATHILVLNQDAYFQNGHFSKLLDRLHNYNQHFEHRTTLDRFASPMIYTEDFKELMPFIKMRYFAAPIPNEPFDIPDFVAVALLVPVDLFKRLKGFDESFFMYYEDNDLIARSKIKNAVTIFPSIHVAHRNPELDGEKMSAEKNRWLRKSYLKYLWRHESKGKWLVEKLKWEIKKYWI